MKKDTLILLALVGVAWYIYEQNKPPTSTVPLICAPGYVTYTDPNGVTQCVLAPTT